MDVIDGDFFNKEKRGFKRAFGKLPKFLRYSIFTTRIFLEIVGALGLLGFATGEISVNVSSLNVKGITTSVINQNQKVTQGSMIINNINTIDNCLNCSDFKDGKWRNIERFIKVQDDPLILKSPHTKALPGAIMFYREKVKNFKMQVILTPQASTSANIIVRYGQFSECIIGDANYEFVSCKVNISYPGGPVWSYIDKDGRLYGKNEQHQISSFEPKKDLQLSYEFNEMGSSRIISIKINDKVPLEWKLPKESSDQDQLDQVGLGLFTTKYDDVQAVFKSFQLDPHI